MSTIFTIPNLLYIINTIEEFVCMSESPSHVDLSYNDYVNEIILSFSLKHGTIKVSIFGQNAGFKYFDCDLKVLTSANFGNESITDTNGSFHTAFRQIRKFDRERASVSTNTDTSIDRASFGLSEVN
jgi:hypothetical protein